MSPRAPQKGPRALACYRCWRGEPAMVGTEFSLLGFCALRAVQKSPCFCILGKNSRFFACWESFVPLGACSAGCVESFVPLGACSAGCGESFVPLGACSAGCGESFVPPGVCSAGCGESFVLGWSFSDAVGFTVMTSLCSGCEKVRPVRSDVNANAKMFAQQGKNGLKIAVHGVLGECCRVQGTGVFFWVTRR